MKPIRQGLGSKAPLTKEEAPDIVGDAAYSIQEDKLKTEDDNRFSTTKLRREVGGREVDSIHAQ